jgi:excisionase family DNA binding protein
MPDEEYITVPEASKLSGLSARQIRGLLQNGTIPGIKPGRDWMVMPSVVMDYLRQERKPGRRPKKQE